MLFFWVTNFGQEQLSLLFFVCAHIVHVMLHTHKCKLTQFPQKQNNKSDWCWQRWLCNWVTQFVKLQGFQDFWSQVSDSDSTSFLLQTCQQGTLVLLITMEFSPQVRWKHVGKALDRWVALASAGIFPFGWQKIPKMIKVAEIVGRFFFKWFSTNCELPHKFNFLTFLQITHQQ